MQFVFLDMVLGSESVSEMEEEDDDDDEDQGFVQGVLEAFTKHLKDEMSPF